MKKVRVGIVGMGIGRPNAKAIEANERGEVAALCDLEMARMDDFEKDLGHEVKKYTDFKAMCRDKELDAIFVGTPNQTHVPIGLEAVRNGKHVMITKPLADSLSAAKQIVKAAEAAGVVNMMSLSTRFGPGCRYLHKQKDAGVFGDLYYARARSVRRSGIPVWNLGFIHAGGGAFRDMGVHVLDASWALLGFPQPVSVTGVAGAKFGPRGQGYMNYETIDPKIYSQYAADDYGGGFIRFENGAGLQVESFWACHNADEFQIELFGTEGGAKLNPLTIYKTQHGQPTDTTVRLHNRVPNEDWQNIADHFIECIADGKACEAPLRHGMQVQEMMEALLKSAETGREVRLSR
jgi:predicted dehydrogenase